MTKLSVNINKIATLRNARGNVPDLLSSHRYSKIWRTRNYYSSSSDERHSLSRCSRSKAVVYTEFNIEGNPQHNFRFGFRCKPEQVTLVPDAIGAITSSAGWDTVQNQAYLTEMIQGFNATALELLFC
jgi:pyridoxine 5-phosphate synthase